jgi:hypothetical protein
LCCSECTSPRWRHCFGLRPFVLSGESLVRSFVGGRMMVALASSPSLEASFCMSWLAFRWQPGVSLSLMWLRSWCTRSCRFRCYR